MQPDALRPTVDALHQSGQYRLLESFHLDEMGQFIVRQFANPNPEVPVPGWRKWAVPLVLGLAGAGFGYWVGAGLVRGTNGWQALAAIPAFLLILLPIHEAIHALVFKALGARRVGFGWIPKGLMVYAYAQKFVLTLRENSLVAAMPFLVITTLLAGALFLLPGYRPFLWGSLALHSFACVGDLALIRYARRNQGRAIYLYDDVEGEKRSYFFEKIG